MVAINTKNALLSFINLFFFLFNKAALSSNFAKIKRNLHF